MLYALVPCAGVGTRAETGGPKQYANLLGKPVVAHTLDALAGVTRLQRVLVVLSPDDDATAWLPASMNCWIAEPTPAIGCWCTTRRVVCCGRSGSMR